MTFRVRTAAWWRRSVMSLSLAALAATCAWIWQLVQHGDTKLLVAALPALLACACAASVRWIGPAQLRWDGQLWHLVEDAPRSAAACSGSLAAVFDGGGWMLLRLRHVGGAGLRGTWLALSRSDMPAHWHALRCAVYSPRPAPAGPSAQASADPPA
jgi:hypothetical protein